MRKRKAGQVRGYAGEGRSQTGNGSKESEQIRWMQLTRYTNFLRFGSVLGLERMHVLLEKLGNPQDELKVIHVAGTNGKGSICRYVY